ncbi:DUF4358 domain-containing protein [Paenibacillus sp. GCM10027627]|uniref:DUF4358 domain-containing protein n=1 Tax=unclassified Paenibacillus TaxID=185978 RepID=UPI00363FB7AF
MKKTALSLLLVTALLGSLLTACGGNAKNNAEMPKTSTPPTESVAPSPSPSIEPETPAQPEEKAPTTSTGKIINEMVKKVENPPSVMELPADLLKDYYKLDLSLLEEYTVQSPAVSLSSDELTVVKVKDAKDIDAVKKAFEERAADIQKTFETYLPEPYKNAQNYKIATKGNYVLLLIHEKADDLEKAFLEIAAKY